MKNVIKIKKIILIDSTSFQRQQTGIEYYGFEISRNLYNFFRTSPYKVYFVFNKKYPKWFFEMKNIKGIKYKGFSKFIMEQLWIPYIVIKYKINRLYFPVFPPSLLFFLNKKLNIYRTIFDVVMWKHIETISLKNRLYMKPLETIGIKYYHKIFTISNFSKNEIINIFPKINSKVINAGIGLKKIEYNRDTNCFFVLKKYKIEYKKFILFVGTIEPRKNVNFLLDILNNLILKKSSLKLVIVGRKGWGYKKLKNHQYYLKLSNNFIITDFIDDKDLFFLYKNALCLVFPSKYEGFGLPIIESMSLGCPIISANNSSLLEVVEDAGILIDGWDCNKWADNILKLQKNKTLERDIIQKGFSRIKKISWNQTANIIYKELVK